jgi:hypothetical protein
MAFAYSVKGQSATGIVEKEEEYLNCIVGEYYGIRKERLKLSKFG